MPKNPRAKEGRQLGEQPEGSSRLQNKDEDTPPDDKRGRLLSLAKELQQLFPEQYEELAQVIERVEKEKVGSSEQSSTKSPPISVPGKEKKAGHTRGASRGSTTSNVEEEIDPRGRAPDQKDPLIHIFVDHSNILYGLPQLKSATYRKRSNTLQTTATASVTKVDSVGTRPVPVSSTGSNALQDKTQPLSRSFPTTASPLAAGLFEHRTAGNPDGDGGLGVDDTDASRQKKNKPSRALWYAAFFLVLERGRPATRRVVVASKKPTDPETMPMGTIERLGYEVRVLVMVPKSADLEQSKGKGGLSKVGGISRSTSSERGSVNPTHGKTLVPRTLPNKVKYREQGVDELLQLKLYQAITDPEPDDIPDGSTIVLATGDGTGTIRRPGLFGLGPIKTALRQGWNVELYSWEDSLSQAWEREFGEKSKSSKRGVFRIIGMKKFAKWLAYDWA